MTSTLLRRGIRAVAVVTALAIVPNAAQARDAEPTSEAVAMMSPGDFLWNDDPATKPDASGVRIVVSIPDQKMYVYRGVRLMAVSAVSTGKPGHDTPTGYFTILQKQVKHTSNLYDAAPMPYMQRITWDGVAIHAGRDPGYAASHGCVRVPIAFAKRLYAITRLGARVTITDESLAADVSSPPLDAEDLGLPPAPQEPAPEPTEIAAVQ
ncbi:hypothetical protein EWE75_00540 [Sphingomonas populi]|uniref:L,D-TPase catalytic domain-containing protein n=1 Tax=Sphingomonas populi TaxID=2484750 RepID=A0A4Q6Y9R1_9SPHN|nr:L,D-transpeptidase family protein [Sphingomonas populi]RZF66389.1 hypothetical protein EWE75_00540 [Sphingomonas populi]